MSSPLDWILQTVIDTPISNGRETRSWDKKLSSFDGVMAWPLRVNKHDNHFLDCHNVVRRCIEQKVMVNDLVDGLVSCPTKAYNYTLEELRSRVEEEEGRDKTDKRNEQLFIAKTNFLDKYNFLAPKMANRELADVWTSDKS